MDTKQTSSTQQIPHPVLGIPQPLEPAASDTYILWVRYGSNPHAQPKYFKHSGTFQDAIARGKKHCELTNLRFIKVERFFSDFAEEERIHNQ